MADGVDPEQTIVPGDESFASRLRQAISDRGLSLQMIVQELSERGTPVTIATLSYWQSGRSRPERTKSLEALAVLEDVLELPDGELSSRLPQRKPRGRYAKNVVHTPDSTRFVPAYDIANRLMAEMGLPWNDALRRMSIHDRIHVDRFKRSRRMEHRMVLRSDRDGVEGMVFVYAPDESTTCDPLITAVSNCTLGKVARWEDPSLVLAELRFPKPLNKDEIAMIEFEVRTPTGGRPSDGESRAFRTPVREYVLEAVFDPRALPYRVVAVHSDSPEGNDFTMLHDLKVHDGVAQFLVLDIQPGHYGIRYAWTEEETREWEL